MKKNDIPMAGQRPRTWGFVLVGLLLLSTFPPGAGDCCSVMAPAPQASTMSCCASEQTLTCPECPAPHGGAPASFAATGPANATGAVAAALAQTPTLVDDRPPIPAPGYFRLEPRTESPPLYRLHSQLLI